MNSVDRGTHAVPHASRAMILAAFAAIYLIWGSTYLAIKVAIETVPPFLMTGVRFLIAGGVLYAWSFLRTPRGVQRTGNVQPSLFNAWRDAFVVGALLIVGGTSLVGWAELSVPSGITSLILATTPLWMVLLDGASNRRAPSGRVLAGVVVGLGGLAILIGPSLWSPGEGVNLLGAGTLVLASLTWTIGALYSRRLPHVGSPARSTGMQMIAGAVLSILIGIAIGELDRFSLANVTPSAVFAVSYLVVAGALVGFSAYLWLMRVSTPSRVATHAYVNPVVAVLLGWAVLAEAVTMRTGVAMAVIVAAVVLIVSAPARAEPTPLHKRDSPFLLWQRHAPQSPWPSTGAAGLKRVSRRRTPENDRCAAPLMSGDRRSGRWGEHHEGGTRAAGGAPPPPLKGGAATSAR